MKSRKLKVLMGFLLILSIPLGVASAAETQILLYKHHSLQVQDWKDMATANSALIDPNGDGDTSDSTWVSPNTSTSVVDTAPTAPTFTAEYFDGNGVSQGML